MNSNQEPGVYLRSGQNPCLIYGIGRFKNDRIRICLFYTGNKAWHWYVKDKKNRSLWAPQGYDGKVKTIELAFQRIKEDLERDIKSTDHSDHARARVIQQKCICLTERTPQMLTLSDIPIPIDQKIFDDLFTNARKDAKDLPSASAMPRYAICPGSYNLVKRETSIDGEEPSEDAIWGVLMHAVLSGVDIKLPEDRQAVVEGCRKQVEALRKNYSGKVIKEKRMFLVDDDLNEVASAKLDIAIIGDEKALIVDYKTGWNEAPYAPVNWQLRCQAIILKEHYSRLKEIDVAIVQPLLNNAPVVCTYDSASIQRAKEDLLGILDSIKIGFPITPCPSACVHCPGKSICQPYKDWIDSLMPEKWRHVQFSGKWDANKWRVYLECRKSLKQYIDKLDNEAREFLKQNPQALPDYKLSVNRGISVIRSDVHPLQIYNRLLGILPNEELIGCYSRISLTNVKAAIAKVYKLSQAEASKKFLEVMKDALVVLPRKQRVIKVNESGEQIATAAELLEEGDNDTES